MTKYHNIYVRKIGIDNNTKVYIQSIALKKILETIFFDYRRNNMLKVVRREAAITEAQKETVRYVEVLSNHE